MTVRILHGDCRDVLRTLPEASVDAVVTDPPYPEIDRPYGRVSEAEWHTLMHDVVGQIRRVLRPTGSAAFILQANSERLGRMRPWLWEFMVWGAREWNQVQDAYWWNHAAMPTAHTAHGLMRPSVKVVVWLGAPDCYRNQSAVLWTPSVAMQALAIEDRALRRCPSGHRTRKGRIAATVAERGGVTPFNLLPVANSDSTNSGGADGHGAATPRPLLTWWVQYLCPPGGTVLDPFGGSGTVGRVCEDTGRHSILIEANPDYCRIAERRCAQRGLVAMDAMGGDT